MQEGRLRIFEDQTVLTIEIGPIRDWRRLLREIPGPLVFSALSIQGMRLLVPMGRGGHAVLAWLYVLLFGYFGAVSFLRFIWVTLGHEEIVLRGGLLTISRRFGIISWSRTYRLSVVKDIHAVFRLTSRFRPLRGRIGFRYENKMKYMADRIDSHDAKMLVKTFREWLPRNVWTPVLGL
jgi:hypothetical protein